MKTFEAKTKKRIIWTVSVLLLLSVTVGGCAIYLGDYYRADDGSIESFVFGINVEKTDIGKRITAFEPSDAEIGFIFYPGGKVEADAYLPLMAALAQKGILTVLVRMPFNLAVFDMSAADGIAERFPEIEHWYIGGHSLGGAMAASYVSSHDDEFDGLVLLAAYSASDISATDLRVLSIYGSDDGVMNREKYDQYISNLPHGFEEIIINGGNHAGFGMYGAQSGDGTPSIPGEEQIRTTADAIYKFIESEE